MSEKSSVTFPYQSTAPSGPGRTPGRVRFSLVLGTKDRTRELERFLQSLANQTYRDFELIMVDQNPDDRLKSILAPYAGRYSILHLSSEPGLSRAKNKGLDYATGELIGFPDDDCQFPEDLLHRVARFFEDHPSEDGLTGRAVDESGEDINKGFDRKTGRVNMFNVWRRGIAFNIFVRRHGLRDARFDEQMGPGSGTNWGAGDETDYLLQLLARGLRLFYDPNLVVIHPRPQAHYNADALNHRAYVYACGGGRTIRKHDYPEWFTVWWVARSFGRLILSAASLEGTSSVRYRWHTLRGKLDGLRSARAAQTRPKTREVSHGRASEATSLEES